MKALLRTRCGCTKMIDIPEKRMEIRLPLTSRMDWNWTGAEELPPPKYDYRRFRLYGTGELPYGSGDVTVYEEVE